MRSILETEWGFEVVAEAGDGGSALRVVEDLQPDAVLLDVQLPGLDGFEVARRLAGRPGAPYVILTSTRDASDYGSRLLTAPVVGFVSKHELSPAVLWGVIEASLLKSA